MLEWLLGDDVGMARIQQHFSQMIEDGRHVFDAACNTVLGGTDPGVVREDLHKTDQRINRLEQQIRRELVVHMTVREKAEIGTCLKFMSLVKDAERIGDYGKNIFDMGQECRDFVGDPMSADLIAVKDHVSRMLAKMRNLFESQSTEQARRFVDEAHAILRHCDERVSELVRDASLSRRPVVAALLYRYVKRVMAHAMNIVTSILVPLDKLDYLDEDDGDRV
ncbi:MAG: hypothetical protein H6825_07140 [Planctomycetes bacterium]|nr:hypothetical protein [Planctomycetota bacterium]